MPNIAHKSNENSETQSIRVSVVIPCYNGEKYLLETINSVINQSFSNWELIIVNDASTDKTAEILSKVQDKRLKVIHLKENKGIGNGRNLGMEISQGEYIAFLDADDLFLPENLAEKVNFLDNNPAFDAVTSWTEAFDTLTQNINYTLKPDVSNPLWDLLSFRVNVVASPSSFFIRKTAALEIGKWSDEINTGEDWDYWVRYCAEKKLGVINKTLVRYRIHPLQTTWKFERMCNNMNFLLQKAYKTGYFHKAVQQNTSTNNKEVTAKELYQICLSNLYLIHAGSYRKYTKYYFKILSYLLKSIWASPSNFLQKIKSKFWG